MKLTYRGQTYEYNPPQVETTAGETAGKYRGLDWRFRNLDNPPVLQPRLNLTYRGVKYNRVGTETTPVVSAQPAVNATQDKARLLMVKQNRNIKKRQQTLLNRVSSEIGLSDVSDYWNRVQGKVHPSFRGSYRRFGATMS